MTDDQINSYQRGNRDGLLSFAKWAYEMYESYRKEAEEFEFKACENGSLSFGNVRMSITTRRYMAESFKKAAEKAERMASALPHDPYGAK